MEESDAAQRMMDAVNLHVSAMLAGLDRTTPGYVAIRLSDGRSPDGILYDSRKDAARHQSDQGVTFVKVGRESMGFREALIVLQMNRRAYKAGEIFTEQEVIATQLSELMLPFIPRTLKGLS